MAAQRGNLWHVRQRCEKKLPGQWKGRVPVGCKTEQASVAVLHKRVSDNRFKPEENNGLRYPNVWFLYLHGGRAAAGLLRYPWHK